MVQDFKEAKCSQRKSIEKRTQDLGFLRFFNGDRYSRGQGPRERVSYNDIKLRQGS